MTTSIYPAPSASVNPMNTPCQPHGYYNLKVGTKFIVLDGKALPITGLAGRIDGGCFYPNAGDIGYLIKERTATQREQYAAAKPEAAPRPVVSGFDPSDWK